jgi:hypothetical protein
VRTTVLEKKHAKEQVKTIRSMVIRTPGKLVRHARRVRLKLMSGDPLVRLLDRAAEQLWWIRPIPLLVA